MEVNWSTFILEIINFLVLVWILKRFLYRPVLDVIAQRRSGIEKSLSEAQSTRDEAERLQQQYEHRLENWETTQQQAREKLRLDIEEERSRLLSQLKNEVNKEKEKAVVLAERDQAAVQRHNEEQAFKQATQFTAKLLNRLASPELEAQLIKLLLDELAALPAESINMLRGNVEDQPIKITVSSAFPLLAEQQDMLANVLNDLCQHMPSITFEQDSSLIAGLRVTIGAWVLQTNLSDELQGFLKLGLGHVTD